MKKCRECETVLKAGVNAYQSLLSRGQLICKPCQKIYRDSKKATRNKREREARRLNPDSYTNRKSRMCVYPPKPENYAHPDSLKFFKMNNCLFPKMDSRTRSAKYQRDKRASGDTAFLVKQTEKRARQRARQRDSIVEMNAGEKAELDALYLYNKIMPGDWEVDHIIALANGGKHHPSNLQILSQFDNRSKGAR